MNAYLFRLAKSEIVNRIDTSRVGLLVDHNNVNHYRFQNNHLHSFTLRNTSISITALDCLKTSEI